MRLRRNHKYHGFRYVHSPYGQKKVQENLWTEPKEPEQALEFAIAFEEVKRQKSYGT